RRPARPAGPGTHPGCRAGPGGHPRRAARGGPRGGGPGGLRPARGVPGPAAAALGQAAGRLPQPRPGRDRRTAGRARPGPAPLPRAHRGARRLPAGQRPDRRGRLDPGDPRLGDVHARRPADRPRPARHVQHSARPARLAGLHHRRGTRAPDPRRTDRAVRRALGARRDGRRLVHGLRLVQAGRDPRRHPLPLHGGPDGRPRVRPHRRPGPRLHRARPHHSAGPSGGLIVMDFAFDARTEELRTRLLAFMDEHVHPAERVAHEQRAGLASPWDTVPVVEELKAEARRQGLWNLFLPDSPYGAGLTNLQYAPLAEIMGRSPQLAPTATNCAAPDTGNMEVLAQFGDEQQKKQWLEPLLAGEIRSAFAMTEPEVASSDATNITTHIRRDGDEYVISGRKWYISGAMHPDCKIFIVMGKTDPDGADIRRQQSMVLVPRDTPGVTIQRAMRVFGYEDEYHGGHAEVVFDEARVPVANLIGEEGGGFAIAQARLGPGRIHHCMRLIGMAER